MWWLSTVCLLGLGAVLYVTSALHVLSFSPLVTGRQEAARDDAVRAALARHPAPDTVGNSRAPRTVQLQMGEHPGAEQFDVPIPSDARMPTARPPGVERTTPMPDRSLLATSHTVAEVLAFYRAELATSGWHEVRAWMTQPANGVPGPGGAVSAFCREIDGPALLVGAASQEAGWTEVRLLIDAETPGPCASAAEPESDPDPWNGRPPPVF